MPRASKASKGGKNKSTRGPASRVSTRPNKGVHSSRDGPVHLNRRDSAPNQVTSSDESESDHDANLEQFGPSINPPSSTPLAVTSQLEQTIAKLISEGIAREMSARCFPSQPTQEGASTLSDPTDQPPPAKKPTNPGNALGHVPNTLSLEDCQEPEELEAFIQIPVVRNSFGLLVGEHVPLAIRQKIIANKDIDMIDLLPDAKVVSDKEPLVLAQARAGAGFGLQVFRESKIKFITLSQWNEAFAHFMAIYHTRAKTLSESHTLMLQLLTYQSFINTIAAKNSPWWKYDIQFRRDMNANPGRFSFSDVRHDLCLALNISAFTKPNQSFRSSKTSYSASTNFKSQQNSGPASQASKPLSSANQTSNAASPLSLPKGFCFSFHNRGKFCNARGTCQFSHACPKCNATHPAFKCTK